MFCNCLRSFILRRWVDRLDPLPVSESGIMRISTGIGTRAQSDGLTAPLRESFWWASVLRWWTEDLPRSMREWG